MILSFLLLILPSQGAHFHPTLGGSPIAVCRLLSSLGQGMIYTGSTTACTDSSLVVIKCDKHASLEREFNVSKEIVPISSFVYETVFEPSRPLQLCFTMRLFGPSLASVRDKNRGVEWPWSHIAILGIRIVEQLALVHGSGYAHRDLHFGNVVAGDQDVTDLPSLMSRELFIIDFGDAVKLEDSGKTRSDLLQVLVALRYLVDGDYRYYAEKRYGFHPRTAMDARRGGICIDTPASYCGVLNYVFELKPMQIPDYGFVISQLSDI
jgi:hypothetical protein